MHNNSFFQYFLILILPLLYHCKSDSAQSTETVVEQPQPVLIPEATIPYVMGLFNPEEDNRFVEIDIQYADKAGRLMHRDAYLKFIEMYNAAAKEGIALKIISAARNFEYQKGIWERKWTGETKIENGKDASVAYPDPKVRALKILTYSSMPGSSRHHWGTDIDLNSFENSWFEQGNGLKVFNWLEQNASRFGYCRPYTKKDIDRSTGYNEEKWHWSYLPIAQPLTEFAKNNLSEKEISGFLGSTVAEEIGIVKNYVLGINKECLSNK